MDKAIYSFYAINGILRVKKTEDDNAIKITYDIDLR